MRVALHGQQAAGEIAVEPNAVLRQPWTRPQMSRCDAAEAESAPGGGPDSGFVVS